MKEQKIIDHLFRHQYGKMVSILTRIFGLSHLEMVEDANLSEKDYLLKEKQVIKPNRKNNDHNQA
jgi:hypothetical protein